MIYCLLRDYSSEGRKRLGGLEGGTKLDSSRSLTGLAVTSSRVPSSESGGDATSPLWNYPSEEQKRRGGREIRETELVGPCGVWQERWDFRPRPLFKGGGCSVAPSGIIRRGDKGDALDWREGPKNLRGLTESPRKRWDFRPRSGVQCRDALSPPPECSLGGVKEM